MKLNRITCLIIGLALGYLAADIRFTNFPPTHSVVQSNDVSYDSYEPTNDNSYQVNEQFTAASCDSYYSSYTPDPYLETIGWDSQRELTSLVETIKFLSMPQLAQPSQLYVRFRGIPCSS